jgi:hypothetical protein
VPKGASPFVAHVADPGTGQLVLLVGERAVRVHDAELVAELVHLTQREK